MSWARGSQGASLEAGQASCYDVSGMKQPKPRLVPKDGDAKRDERAGGRAGQSAESLTEGTLVGDKYRLLSLLDEGGMGALWVAENEALHMQVALKVIRGDLANHRTAQMADRLLQEARASAKLGHPAIVRTLDFGTIEAGNPYIVMELLQGEDLASALERRGRVSAKKAVQILLPIIHALAAAHDKGIVHRDVKPENIFLASGDGTRVQPKLIDFGVAKLERPAAERLTGVGSVVGSPGYMSPEQARGDEAELEADIWSICVVAYEMITGRLPFQGKNQQAIFRSIIEDTAPPIASFRAGDDVLWAILDRGLQKDPEHRWESMRAMGVALGGWAADRGATEDICGGSIEAVWLSRVSATGSDGLGTMPPPADGDGPSSGTLAHRDANDTPILSAADISGVSIQPVAQDVAPQAASRPHVDSSPGVETAPEIVPSPSAAARMSNERFRIVVFAVTVVVVILGSIALWRLTEPEPPRAPAPLPAQPATGSGH